MNLAILYKIKRVIIMNKEKPVLVFDVDGVLLHWPSNLPFFARDNGLRLKPVLANYTASIHVAFTEIFGVSNEKVAMGLANKYNLSSHGRYLAAYDDAVDNLYKLNSQYKLVIVTSFGDTVEHYSNRCRNLSAFFPNAFEEVICLGYGVDKSTVFDDIERNHGTIVGFIDDQLFNLDSIKKYAKANNKDQLLNNCIHLNRYDDNAEYSSMEEIVEHFLIKEED